MSVVPTARTAGVLRCHMMGVRYPCNLHHLISCHITRHGVMRHDIKSHHILFDRFQYYDLNGQHNTLFLPSDFLLLTLNDFKNRLDGNEEKDSHRL